MDQTTRRTRRWTARADDRGTLSGRGALAERGCALAAKIFMQLARREQEQEFLSHGLRALALRAIKFARGKGSKLVCHNN